MFGRVAWVGVAGASSAKDGRCRADKDVEQRPPQCLPTPPAYPNAVHSTPNSDPRNAYPRRPLTPLLSIPPRSAPNIEFVIHCLAMNRPPHRKALWLIPLLLPVLLLAPAGEALVVGGLYSHRAEISSDTESERRQAFREAFMAVILKVTGHERWLTHPDIVSASNRAQDYVEAFSYSSEAVLRQSATAVPREQRFIEVDFSEARINEMLRVADIPVWGNNRPSVLVWLVMQDPAGERRMISADSHPEIIERIQTIAAERALPVIFPLLDFEDRRNLPMDAIWSLDEDAIGLASQRYGADSTLAGRVLQTQGDELVGLWQFTFQDTAMVFDGLDYEWTPYLRAPLARVTNQLAEYFAVVYEEVDPHSVRLRVRGVESFATYNELMNYLRGLELVDTLTTTALEGSQLELQLSLEGEVQNLIEVIALERNLMPAMDSGIAAAVPERPEDQDGQDGQDGQEEPENPMMTMLRVGGILDYRWTR